jgi:hypothetical protein
VWQSIQLNFKITNYDLSIDRLWNVKLVATEIRKLNHICIQYSFVIVFSNRNTNIRTVWVALKMQWMKWATIKQSGRRERASKFMFHNRKRYQVCNYNWYTLHAWKLQYIFTSFLYCFHLESTAMAQSEHSHLVTITLQTTKCSGYMVQTKLHSIL